MLETAFPENVRTGGLIQYPAITVQPAYARDNQPVGGNHAGLGQLHGSAILLIRDKHLENQPDSILSQPVLQVPPLTPDDGLVKGLELSENILVLHPFFPLVLLLRECAAVQDTFIKPVSAGCSYAVVLVGADEVKGERKPIPAGNVASGKDTGARHVVVLIELKAGSGRYQFIKNILVCHGHAVLIRIYFFHASDAAYLRHHVFKFYGGMYRKADEAGDDMVFGMSAERGHGKM